MADVTRFCSAGSGLFVQKGLIVTKEIKELKSPPRKIISFLKTGRDKLREKYRELRVEFRVAENQVRAVTKSRESWRRRAEAAEAQRKQLNAELEIIKKI